MGEESDTNVETGIFSGTKVFKPVTVLTEGKILSRSTPITSEGKPEKSGNLPVCVFKVDSEAGFYPEGELDREIISVEAINLNAKNSKATKATAARVSNEGEGNNKVKKPIIRRQILDKETQQFLKKWLFKNRDNPYMGEDEKLALSKKTGMSLAKLNNWFVNARRRLLCKRVTGDFKTEYVIKPPKRNGPLCSRPIGSDPADEHLDAQS
eukprot:Nk52_evm10s2010 gene=Nk52_evmTU10s2010